MEIVRSPSFSELTCSTAGDDNDDDDDAAQVLTITLAPGDSCFTIVRTASLGRYTLNFARQVTVTQLQGGGGVE